MNVWEGYQWRGFIICKFARGVYFTFHSWQVVDFCEFCVLLTLLMLSTLQIQKKGFHINPASVFPHSTHIECKVASLPGMLGAVSAAVLFDGDDLNDVKNTTHVISPPKTMIIYEPSPVIQSIFPTTGVF